MKSKRALVFFSYRSHKRGYIEMLFDRLRQAAENRDIELCRGSLNDLHIQIKDNALSVREALNDEDIAAFDVTYFELWYKAQQQALAAATYLSRRNKAFFSHEVATLPAMTKIGELAVLADNGIPLPDSFMSSHREILQVFKAAEPPVAFPLIMKAADGYGGKNNFLIRDYDELQNRLNDHTDLQFVIQAFVPNDCDYRCLVLGGAIRLVLRRTRDQQQDTHLNNTSAGAVGDVVPVESLPLPASEAVLQAARVLGRSEFAGVDLIIDSETGQPYILEVNQTPQIEIGAETESKMTALLDYLQERAV